MVLLRIGSTHDLYMAADYSGRMFLKDKAAGVITPL